MLSESDYDERDGVGLAELIRAGHVTATEVVERAIVRVEAHNPKLNAVVTPMFDSALEAAKKPSTGPLAGVPMVIKDLTSSCKGVPFTSGSRFFADYVPAHDSALLACYRAAGLIFVGKSNTPEFGLLPVTESTLLGTCSNPWALDRTPGGSSGGSAAAVAARMVPIGHGGDGGGSLRIPASCCGLFGLKPSRGRQPTGPDAGEHWLGFGIEHALTRSVRDSATLLDLSAEPDPTAPYHAPTKGNYASDCARDPAKLRIAFTAKPFLPARVHGDTAKAVYAAATLCQELGHNVEEIEVPLNGEQFAKSYFQLVCALAASALTLGEEARKRKVKSRDFETNTWLLVLIGQGLGGGEVLAAKRKLEVIARKLCTFTNQFDVLLTPTLGGPPLRHGALKPRGFEGAAQNILARSRWGTPLKYDALVEAGMARVFNFMPYTPVANVTGQPSMSVPLFWNDQGLPMGALFTGRYGDESTLFRLAGQLERARPWSTRRPPAF